MNPTELSQQELSNIKIWIPLSILINIVYEWYSEWRIFYDLADRELEIIKTYSDDDLFKYLNDDKEQLYYFEIDWDVWEIIVELRKQGYIYSLKNNIIYKQQGTI